MIEGFTFTEASLKFSRNSTFENFGGRGRKRASKIRLGYVVEFLDIGVFIKSPLFLHRRYTEPR